MLGLPAAPEAILPLFYSPGISQVTAPSLTTFQLWVPGVSPAFPLPPQLLQASCPGTLLPPPPNLVLLLFPQSGRALMAHYIWSPNCEQVVSSS